MKYLIPLFILLLISCDKEETETQQTLINTSLSLYILDEHGEDLLNPLHSNAIHEDDIKMYYVKNGKEELFSRPNLDVSKGFRILKPQGDLSNYWINLFLNSESEEEVTTTILKWSDYKIDTLQASFMKGSDFIRVSKIWLNGKICWDPEDSATFVDNPITSKSAFTIIRK
jgi:hypothetical protein